MTLTKAILVLGNFDSTNQFFERDYANKWHEAGYKTAFFDRITHRHIGRLTSEIKSGTVKNAYELNGEAQFQANTNQSPIKIVNLERRADRKKAISQLFKENHLTDFVFFKAVDGKTLESTNELKTLFKDNDFGSRKGVIGCALSHYQLWKELVADKNHPYYVIFEDDVSLCTGTSTSAADNFKKRFDQLKPEMEKQEVLFLGYSMYHKKRAECHDLYDNLTADSVIKVEPLNKNLYIGGFYSYAINKLGAQKLIDYIDKNGIKHGIDYLIKIVPGLNCCEIQPFLAFSAWYEEKDKPIDTDIQTNYESLDFNKTLEDDFEFMPQLDQIGHDIYFQPGNLTDCMNKALKDPNCVGFNTLGFFKNKIEILTTSQYFKESDGMYIKKSSILVPAAAPLALVPSAAPPLVPASVIKIKMLGNWCSSEQLCKEWNIMYHEKWNTIQLTASNDPQEIDYYVIINSPPADAHYIPKKTIVFQMEPWIADPQKKWGVKTWGEWAAPDPQKFYKVFTHKTHLNNVQWQIDYPFYSQPVVKGDTKLSKVAVICSEKNFDDGHLLRNNFIKYIEATNPPSTHPFIDIWGRANYHHFQNYKGIVPSDNKYNVYANYKYCLAAENNSEINYATEKIWESILCESLCFYWGCPNLETYLDEKAFVRLPLEDPAAAKQIIQQAIAEDWWSQRIDVIKQMKERILNQLGFFPFMTELLH
jgi:GR25 family glycosyltransferase involved in LPS biosynthesis